VRLDELLDDGEADPTATPAGCLTTTPEPFEDVRKFVLRNPGPLVAHKEFRVAAVASYADAHRATVRRELERIAD
jgi:hypothetical protein